VTVRRLAVVGTGLMGASVGLAAKRAGVENVAGFDVDREALAAALERGAVDAASDALGEAVEDADLVVVATPVRMVPELVLAVSELVGKQCKITDVGSTKARICSELAGVPTFVGGHPMCGSEASGPEPARADLFDGATWFLAGLPDTDRASRDVVTDFATSLGALPVEIDPETHDRLVALVSHLPHALANLLVTQAAAAEIEGFDPLTAAGASFRDMTRIAGTNPQVWSDIFLDNRQLLAATLAAYRGRIEALEAALREGDEDAVLRSIDAAAAHRRR
jgi:prephenate dehydrogenase